LRDMNIHFITVEIGIVSEMNEKKLYILTQNSNSFFILCIFCFFSLSFERNLMIFVRRTNTFIQTKSAARKNSNFVGHNWISMEWWLPIK
jgi:hypothetical protein